MSIAADFNFGKHMQNSFLLMRTGENEMGFWRSHSSLDLHKLRCSQWLGNKKTLHLSTFPLYKDYLIRADPKRLTDTSLIEKNSGWWTGTE